MKLCSCSPEPCTSNIDPNHFFITNCLPEWSRTLAALRLFLHRIEGAAELWDYSLFSMTLFIGNNNIDKCSFRLVHSFRCFIYCSTVTSRLSQTGSQTQEQHKKVLFVIYQREVPSED